jgi:hypothetical protein
MPKKSRARRDIALEQYELPGFAAGMVIGHLEAVLDLLASREAKHGRTSYDPCIYSEIRLAIQHAREWQIRAQVMTRYPYGRRDP